MVGENTTPLFFKGYVIMRKKITKCFYCKEEINEDDIIEYPISEKSNRCFHNKKDCYNKYLFEKTTKCSCCKKKILFNDDYVMKNKKFYHSNCLKEYSIQLKEQEEWNKLYTYVKEKILKYPKELSLSKTQMFALKELREGKILINGAKQEYQGYTYFDIYSTFVLQQHNILNGIQGKSFKNENAKFRYIIAIIKNNINDIVLKRLQREESKKKVDDIEFETQYNNNYIKKSTCNEKEKLLELLNDNGW